MTIDNKQILIVDDDPGLRELLEKYLSEQGFEVTGVEDGESMDSYLQTSRPDLVILDLMLPGEDGLSIAGRLRNTANLPVIMISARGEEVDRIIGLEVGADDYIPKPFNPRELLARIRAVLRRNAEVPGSESSAQIDKQDVRTFEPYRMNLSNHTLLRDDEEISLTSGEFALLEVFVNHANRVLSRDQLVDLLKGFERSPYDRSIDVRVTRLRRKIEEDHVNPRFIRTIWGEGYLFDPSASAEAV